MKISFNLLSSFLCLFICISSLPILNAQNEFINEDELYVDYIKSVSFHLENLPLSNPIIDLNSRSNLILRFDDVAGDVFDYSYKIFHCTKDWQLSDLDEQDYINGFNGESIEEYETSINTVENYTHYWLRIPNRDIEMTISGNYLLVIYDEDLLPIISKRFYVTEKLKGIKVNGKVQASRAAGNFHSHQELSFNIELDKIRLNNPAEDVSITILQNQRWDNAYYDVRPSFIQNNTLGFDATTFYDFPALMEFRSFDIRTLLQVSDNVHSIDLTQYRIDVLLELSKSRLGGNYFFEFDANGKFLLDNEDYGNPYNQSEYCNIVFTLDAKRLNPLDEYYIIGGFSDWKIREEYQFGYDATNNIFTMIAPFKQGRYDYYIVKRTDDGFDINSVEGNSIETENNYTMLIYLSEFSSRYDRLVSVANFNSVK